MRFTKMQGVGNDFAVLDAAALPVGIDLAQTAVTLCDRHVGVGADGLLVVERPAQDAVFFMRMFNPDGTEDVCGNGLRCVGLWAHRAGWVGAGEPFDVATRDGLKAMQILHTSERGRAAMLKVGMGVPKFAPAAIPFCVAGLDRVIGYPLRVGRETYTITALNTGSTHTVIFGATPPDELTFRRVSPLIESHPLFPERTSVLWATPWADGTFHVRIWERGAGETLGCGTGACAVGVAAQVTKVGGLSGPRLPVEVVSQGGSLTIEWRGEGSSVVMSGPAEIVYDGEFFVSSEAVSPTDRQAEF